tara:strand:- start:390 stop:599 length:210 start_codon:yes stop_codon:yes gene_type:complete
MKVGDLVTRKGFDVAYKLEPDPTTGIVVGHESSTREDDDKMIIVRWNDKQWTTDAWHHPDNLEVISESR